MKRFLHWLLGHNWVVDAYSVMGAPIKHCTECGQWAVEYGYGSSDFLVSKEDAQSICGEEL